MTKKLTKKEQRERAARFAESPVSVDEVGTVADPDGNQLKPGESGFMEALAAEQGFIYTEEDRG